MSRSIRGYSSANLTIESLSLLGIDVTTISATTGTIITLNSTTLNATNANITNISIQDLTISNLTSTGTITASDITYKGTDLQTILNTYVLTTTLNTTLGNYVLTTTLNSTLANYVLTSALNTTLSDYVLTTALNTTLSDYVLTTALNTTLSDYVLTTALNTTLSNYVLTSALNTTLSDYVLTTALNTTLTGYAQLPSTSLEDDTFQVMFYDATTNLLHVDSQPTQFTFNPNGNELKVGNVVVNSQLKINNIQNATTLDELNITFLNSSKQFRIAQTAKPLLFIPNEGRIKVYDIEINRGGGANGNAQLNIIADTDNSVEASCPQILLTKDGGAYVGSIRGGTETDSSNTNAENNMVFRINDSTGSDNAFYFNIGGSEKLSIGTATEVKNVLKVNEIENQSGSTISFSLSGTTEMILQDDLINCLAELKCKLQTLTTDANYPVVFNDSTTGGKLSQSTHLQYNPSLAQLTTTNLLFTELTNGSSSSKITVAQPLFYGQNNAISQPLNYTIRIGHTDSIRAIDATGQGLTSGSYGGGNILSILRTGVKTASYGLNADLITWNAYVDATYTPTTFTVPNLVLDGLWHIIMTCQFSNNNSSNRVNPIVRLTLNGTTINEGTESSYVRHQLGRVGTIRYENKLFLSSSDAIQFETFINAGNTTDFSSVVTSSTFDLNDFMFMATYLGNLTEYDRTP